MYENCLQVVPVLFAYFLLLTDYQVSQGCRGWVLHNSPMILGVITRSRSNRELHMKYLCEEREQEDGAVKPLYFPQIMTPKTTAVVIVGNQYDLLFGTGVSKPEQAAIKSFVINHAVEKSASDQDGATQDAVCADFSRNILCHHRGGSKIYQLYFRQDTVGAMLNESGGSILNGKLKKVFVVCMCVCMMLPNYDADCVSCPMYMLTGL